jgi:hypothetical protein
LTYLSNIVRAQSDPKVVRSGHSSLSPTDRLARNLGWMSIALGVSELVAARSIARRLGMRGSEGLIRAYGAREIASGMLSLSVDKEIGLWTRVAGDALDLATLGGGLRRGNPQRGNVGVAVAMVAGITLLDLLAAKAVSDKHARNGAGEWRDYGDRSGFPKGVSAARGAARKTQPMVPQS